MCLYSIMPQTYCSLQEAWGENRTLNTEHWGNTDILEENGNGNGYSNLGRVASQNINALKLYEDEYPNTLRSGTDQMYPSGEPYPDSLSEYLARTKGGVSKCVRRPSNGMNGNGNGNGIRNRANNSRGGNGKMLENFTDGGNANMYNQFDPNGKSAMTDELEDDEYAAWLKEKRSGGRKGGALSFPTISPAVMELITFIFSGVCLIFILDIFVRLGARFH